MIDHAYEKERREMWQDALHEYIMDSFEDFCLEMARKINDRPYCYTYYDAKDVRRIVGKEIR